MWYEVLPKAALIFIGMALPGYGLYGLHYLVLGNHYRRGLLERWDRHLYQRDTRLTGDAYKINGLDSLPDQ